MSNLNIHKMPKFTLASLKSVLLKYDTAIMVKSDFNGMTDWIDPVENPKYVDMDKSKLDFKDTHTFGIAWLRLVGGGSDYFSLSTDEVKSGTIISVSNCCGSCDILIK